MWTTTHFWAILDNRPKVLFYQFTIKHFIPPEKTFSYLSSFFLASNKMLLELKLKLEMTIRNRKMFHHFRHIEISGPL